MCCEEESLFAALVEGTDSYHFDSAKSRFYTERDRHQGRSLPEDRLPNSEEAVNSGDQANSPNGSTYDPVQRPRHYNDDPSGIECIQVVEHRNFCVGNAMKYLWRAGLKDGDKKHIEDLRKSIWYIEREISRLEQQKS